MPAYKDEKKGTWYVSFHYFDWTGKNVRKLKRGFATKRKAQEWEQSFLRTKAASMDMTFSEFFTVYEKDVRPKLKENTWWSKEQYHPYQDNSVLWQYQDGGCNGQRYHQVAEYDA